MTRSQHTLVEIPPGVQCFVGDEARRRRAIEERVLAVFEGWDYEEIIPPLFDYADVFGDAALEAKTYSFVGRDGSLLALRPDFTSLIAKIAGGRLADREPPIRLYYSGEVLRYEPPKAGRQSELYQMGLEHLGGDSASGDVEVLAVAAECLETLGVADFVLALGHVGVFQGLAAHMGLEGDALETVRDRVESKDAGGVRAALARWGGHEAALPMERLTQWTGDRAALDEADRALGCCPPARRALHELKTTVLALEDAGLGARVRVDLSEVAGLDYYTCLVLRVYASDLGFEVGGGGRYDALLARYGRPLPAVGFMLGLDRLALLLDRQGRAQAPPRGQPASIHASTLGPRLREARSIRASGRRIRFGGGRP